MINVNLHRDERGTYLRAWTDAAEHQIWPWHPHPIARTTVALEIARALHLRSVDMSDLMGELYLIETYGRCRSWRLRAGWPRRCTWAASHVRDSKWHCAETSGWTWPVRGRERVKWSDQ